MREEHGGLNKRRRSPKRALTDLRRKIKKSSRCNTRHARRARKHGKTYRPEKTVILPSRHSLETRSIVGIVVACPSVNEDKHCYIGWVSVLALGTIYAGVVRL